MGPRAAVEAAGELAIGAWWPLRGTARETIKMTQTEPSRDVLTGTALEAESLSRMTL